MRERGLVAQEWGRRGVVVPRKRSWVVMAPKAGVEWTYRRTEGKDGMLVERIE